jgi:hypothetical protein
LALFKKLKKLPKPSKRSVVGYLVLAFIIVIIAALYIIKPAQFQWEAAFLVSGAAAIFAGISALLASRSLEVTEKALELTRITMRPFLSCQPGEALFSGGKYRVVLEFFVKNTGPVPANLMVSEIAFFDDSEVIDEDSKSEHYRKEANESRDTVVFPDAVYNMVQEFDLRRDPDKRLHDNIVNGKIRVRFRLRYSAQGREYTTVQTERLGKVEEGLIRRTPTQPQRWT